MKRKAEKRKEKKEYYSKPLEVDWLCEKCHKTLHNGGD